MRHVFLLEKQLHLDLAWRLIHYVDMYIQFFKEAPAFQLRICPISSTLARSSQEHSFMIWNPTQNVCFLEFSGKMWRFNVMPNKLRRGRAAFKHFPCVRLLKWHSFAGCWHLSRAYCKHMEVHDMSRHDLNTRYSLMQRKTDTSGSLKAMWKEWRRKKKQTIQQSRVCYTEITSLLIIVYWLV